MKMETCQVGMFKLPGIVLSKEEITEDKLLEMDEWLKSEQGVGMRMTEVLWSFKTEAQRDWFIMRWSE